MRTFNLNAAERHIEHCKDSRHRPRPPPSKAEIENKTNKRKASVLRNTTGEGRVIDTDRKNEIPSPAEP